MDFLKALGSRTAATIMVIAAVVSFFKTHWWDIAVGIAGGVLIVVAVDYHSDLFGLLGVFFDTPAGLSMLINLSYLAVGFVVIRLVIVWLNHSSVTGKEFEVHLAFDRIFGDARASADLLGKLAIAVAIVVYAFVRG